MSAGPPRGRRAGRLAAAGAAAIALGLASALCGAQPAATSDANAGGAPAPVPASSAPDSPGPAPAARPPDPGPAPTRDAPPLWLVLPLESSDYARAAEAVRDGFLAAAEAAGAKARVQVLPHKDGEVRDAFEKARAGGARVIVGPLVRDDLKSIVDSGLELPVTIALNQLDDAGPMPPRLYTFALAIEADARAIARRMREDAIVTVAVIGGTTPLMKRFAGAFVAEWILGGGAPPTQRAFAPTADGLAALRRDLAAVPLDAIVIAVEGSDAALVKNFAPRVATWASAQINQRQDASATHDLEEVRFVDVGWLVAPDAEPYGRLPRPEWGSAALDRLYALGIDAYRVAAAFVEAPPDSLAFDGATGRVTLGDARQIQREGRLATFRAGRIVPIDSRR